MTILTAHFQVLTTFTQNVDVAWPHIFADLSSAFSFVNFDVFSFMALECMFPVSYYDQLMLTFSIVFVGLPMMMLSNHLTITFSTANKVAIRNSHWHGALWLIFIMYPSCCKTFLSLYSCRTIEGRHYLIVDYAQECFDETWWQHSAISLTGIVFFCFGTPLYYFLMLYRNRHKLFIGPKVKARFGFVYAKCES